MEQLKTDVAVIGTGGAGVAAAITAVEGRARVMLFEKRPFPGGTSNYAVCIGVVKKDQEYRDKAFKVHMSMTNWTGNAELVRTWINVSGDIPEWLVKYGFEVIPTPVQATLDTMGKQRGYGGGFPNGYFIHDVYFLPPKGRLKRNGGAAMIKCLMAKAKELGVNVRLATPVKRIFRVGDKITGVVAEDRSGNMVHVDAGAVIVAAGGFNDETEMVKKYSSFEFKLDRHGDCEEGDLFFLCPNLRLTGDGIKMAQEVGADKGSIGIGPLPHVPGPAILGRAPGIMLSQLRIVQEQPYLWVNQQGVRFMDEALMNDHLTSGNLVARQKNKCAYIIFDEDTKRHLEEEGLDYEYFLFQAKKLVDLKGDFLKVIGRGNKHAFIADTLEDLAGQTGIDPVVLRKTVDEYNGYCERGHDDQYAKDPKFLRPIRKGKFYAVRVLSAAYQTIGGIKVNRKMEAMTNELKVIPGLYAAGDIIAAELFGDPPTVGIGTLSVALATGIVAGESALQYIRD